jgi:hypothetical protein
MGSKVKPLIRYLLGTSNILTMCHLTASMGVAKMLIRVARKLFATIRYRFSHLDKGLTFKTQPGQSSSSGWTLKLLKILYLTRDSRLMQNAGVPVVVAD